MSRNWLAVASAEHVRVGRQGGFMQVCHGKAGPLARVQPGDRVVYYSPMQSFRGGDRLQAFTALGVVKDGAVHQADMGGGFRPHRRDVDWHSTRDTPIAGLRDRLELTRTPNWGYRLRRGLVEIGARDMDAIGEAMLTVAARPRRRVDGRSRGSRVRTSGS